MQVMEAILPAGGLNLSDIGGSIKQEGRQSRSYDPPHPELLHPDMHESLPLDFRVHKPSPLTMRTHKLFLSLNKLGFSVTCSQKSHSQ